MLPDEMKGAIWYLPSPTGEGTLIYNAHSLTACMSRAGGCALHKPSHHWARDMPLVWVHDPMTGGQMYRVCPCGNHHDDPDDAEYRRSRGMRVTRLRDCKCDCCQAEPCETEPAF